jgi:hypothetical protein
MPTFTFEDKNVLLRADIAWLKRQLRKAHKALRYRVDQALYFQAEQDRYREQVQERKHDF